MNSNHLPVSGGFAVTIAVVVSYFVIESGILEGVRPGGDRREIPQVHGIEDVQARLWQDPFAAAAEHQKNLHGGKDAFQFNLEGKAIIQPLNEKSPVPVEANLRVFPGNKSPSDQEASPHVVKLLQQQMAREVMESGYSVDVLAVMVSAGPNPEDHEIRLRRRYAVIAGLAVSGYQPIEGAHIGYVNDLKDSGCGNGELGAGKLPEIMPFEWFRNKQGRYSLLLWLDEGAFSNEPLCKLNSLFQKFSEEEIKKMVSEGKSDEEKPEKNIGIISVIGPHSSGTLKTMLSELKKNKDNTFPNLKGVFFHSATATAAPAVLLEEPYRSASHEQEEEIMRRFLDKKIFFFRTIADDRKLTDQLVKEIQRRVFDRPRNKEKNFQIALISEWDTLYGRSLPEAFTVSAYQHFQPNKDNDRERNNKMDAWAQEHIHRFSYLRGIDGNTAQKQGDSAQTTSEQATKETRKQRNEIEGAREVACPSGACRGALASAG